VLSPMIAASGKAGPSTALAALRSGRDDKIVQGISDSGHGPNLHLVATCPANAYI